MLVETVRDHPSDGFAVLDATGGDTPNIVRSVTAGWSMAAVDADMAEEIVQRLARADLTAVADDISRLLANAGRGNAQPTEWHRFPAARTLAADLWSAIGTHPSAADMDSWLTRAINSAAGRVAMFWVNAIAADWRAAGDNWTGLPSETRAQLEVMLHCDDIRCALAEVVLSSQILLLFGADRAWTGARILLIDLSHAYITTISAGFVPSAAQLGSVVGQPTSRITCVG